MSEHESQADKPRDIGLKAIRDARHERATSKAGSRITGKASIIGIGAVLLVVLVSWLYRDRSLAAQKEDLLSKERAALKTVGAEWLPLRDKLEKATMEAAGPYKGDYIDPEATNWDFRTIPGIYLRLRAEDAKDVASIRKAADASARDSFVGCLMRENNPSAANIAAGQDAGSGWNDQPWNLRLLYYATRIFNDEWTSEVKDAEDELHLRVFVQQYEKAAAEGEELSLMADVVKRARFFLLVVDEDAPEAHELVADAGKNAGKVTEQEVQQFAHPARISIYDLKRDKEMVRLRRSASASAEFHPGVTAEGTDGLTGRLTASARDPRVLAAVKRQVNNCALANSVAATLKLPEK